MTDEQLVRVKIPRAVWYSIVMSYLCCIAVTAGALFYMKHVDNESNHRWCTAVVAIDDAFRSSPNTTQSQTAKKIADAYSKLRNDFEC